MRLITANDTELGPTEADTVFEDPVSYLAGFGIEAELISGPMEVLDAA